MYKTFFRFFILSISFLFSSLAIAQADQPDSRIEPQSLSNAELDALLANRQWNKLGVALTFRSGNRADFIRTLDWLEDRIAHGAGVTLSMVLARDLWNVGNIVKGDTPDTDFRMRAALMTLYAYEQIMIDGATCSDPTAPAGRLEILMMTRKETLEYLRHLPFGIKNKIVDSALELEKNTASLRKDDDFICGENDIKKETISAGSSKFLKPDAFKPVQEKIRASMQTDLFKLAGFVVVPLK